MLLLSHFFQCLFDAIPNSRLPSLRIFGDLPLGFQFLLSQPFVDRLEKPEIGVMNRPRSSRLPVVHLACTFLPTLKIRPAESFVAHVLGPLHCNSLESARNSDVPLAYSRIHSSNVAVWSEEKLIDFRRNDSVVL